MATVISVERDWVVVISSSLDSENALYPSPSPDSPSLPPSSFEDNIPVQENHAYTLSGKSICPL
jgi:hypothetical protein